MKGLIVFFVCLVVLTSPVFAGTKTLNFTAPIEDNLDTTCTAPQLVAMGTNPALYVHIWWWKGGADSISAAVLRDSILCTPGQAVSRLISGLTPGYWRFRARPKDAGGFACKDTTITSYVKGSPWVVRTVQ